MLKIDVIDQNNQNVGDLELNTAVFGLDTDPGFVHRVSTALSSAQRAGTHSTKTRSTISGGGRKPWKQKGTGRARQGSTRSAQWRHGAVAHGPKPRSYEVRLNKKERRRAMCLVLSDALREGNVKVVDSFSFDEIKTKKFVEFYACVDTTSAVVVLDECDNNLQLSARNVPHAKVVVDGKLSIRDLLKYDQVIFTKAAVGKLEERLS
ncbi:MAG: 50S ribosomal protein L4 [Mariprofundaceae bacterium]